MIRLKLIVIYDTCTVSICQWHWQSIDIVSFVVLWRREPLFYGCTFITSAWMSIRCRFSVSMWSAYYNPLFLKWMDPIVLFYLGIKVLITSPPIVLLSHCPLPSHLNLPIFIIVIVIIMIIIVERYFKVFLDKWKKFMFTLTAQQIIMKSIRHKFLIDTKAAQQIL